MLKSKNKGFTLIELLVVVGILATVSVVAVLVINPSQIFAGTRDSQRLRDIRTLEKVLTFVQYAGKEMGDPGLELVYASMPTHPLNPFNNICPYGANAMESRIPLTGSFDFWCVILEDIQNVDGTGWIPADFGDPFAYGNSQEYQELLAQLYDSSGSVVPKLPVDPVNWYTDGFPPIFYTYFYIPGTDGFSLVAKLESDKHADKALNDGGYDDERYEAGTDKTLWRDALGL